MVPQKSTKLKRDKTEFLFFHKPHDTRHHQQYVESRLSCAIGRLRGINRLLPDYLFTTLRKAYIIPTYDYCLDNWATVPESDVSRLQKKIDCLIIGHFSPSIIRKMYKDKAKRSVIDIGKIDINPLLIRCNILTINERIIWTLIKNIHSCLVSPISSISTIYKFSENQRTSRTFPLLAVERSNSLTLQKSVEFRGFQAWNSLMKDWNL